MSLTSIHPKLPMRDKATTSDFYVQKLGFVRCGTHDYPAYLMVKKDLIELHFFAFEDLRPEENYGMVYIRTDHIDALYASLIENNVAIHPNGKLETKPWGQREFSVLDPDNNLLTFGQEAIGQ